MTPQTLFIIFIAILIIDFIIDKYIDHLNAKQFNDPIPQTLKDVYNKEDYEKSQAYKKENYQFSLITSSFTLLLTLAFFLFKGFAWVDQIARNYSDNEIIITLIFFGIIMLGSDIISTPLSYYQNFVIEEKYGFMRRPSVMGWASRRSFWALTRRIYASSRRDDCWIGALGTTRCVRWLRKMTRWEWWRSRTIWIAPCKQSFPRTRSSPCSISTGRS